MSKIKEAMMDPENHPDTLKRVFLVGDKKVDRETFIKSLSLGLFEYVDIEMEPDFAESNVYDIRAMLHEFVTDGSQATLKIDGVIFSSYYEIIEKREYPLKRYMVSYDILVQPALKFQRRDVWKRERVEQLGHSFKEVRENFRKRHEELNPGRKIKRIKVEELCEVDPENPENERRMPTEKDTVTPA